MNLSGVSKIGSFLIVDVKLNRYKDSDVGNLRKFEYSTSVLDICATCEIRFN